MNLTPTADRRTLDIRKIDGPFTPKDQFFTTQHYGHPEVDPATFRLKVSGLVDRPKSSSLDELRKMGSVELVAGFDCSGNRRPLQACPETVDRCPPLKTAPNSPVCGLQRGNSFLRRRSWLRGYRMAHQTFSSNSNLAGACRGKAMSAEPMLVYALNGEPLRVTRLSAALIAPGWYGVANVAASRFTSGRSVPRQISGAGIALKGEMIDGEMKWKETAVTRMQLKSFIARACVKVNGIKCSALC
jgi:sulfane dehydrogenase subunit SoxC